MRTNRVLNLSLSASKKRELYFAGPAENIQKSNEITEILNLDKIIKIAMTYLLTKHGAEKVQKKQ